MRNNCAVTKNALAVPATTQTRDRSARSIPPNSTNMAATPKPSKGDGKGHERRERQQIAGFPVHIRHCSASCTKCEPARSDAGAGPGRAPDTESDAARRRRNADACVGGSRTEIGRSFSVKFSRCTLSLPLDEGAGSCPTLGSRSEGPCAVRLVLVRRCRPECSGFAASRMAPRHSEPRPVSPRHAPMDRPPHRTGLFTDRPGGNPQAAQGIGAAECDGMGVGKRSLGIQPRPAAPKTSRETGKELVADSRGNHAGRHRSRLETMEAPEVRSAKAGSGR